MYKRQLYAGVGGAGPAAGQWYLRAPAGDVRSSINVEPAWDVTTGDPGVVVAVLDTGVRYDHPDLRAAASGGNLLPGYDMISDAATANDGDGRDADASDPGDWLTAAEVNQRGGLFYQCATGAEDSSWHGTQVAGLIAALTDNGIGMAGIARNVKILPVRVLGKCGGYDSDIIAGMRWAAGLTVPGVPANTHRAQVINMSLSGEAPCSAAYLQTVNDVTAAGTTVVVAAGNTSGHAVGTPANCSGVIAVSGLRHVGTKVGFSGLGPEVALSAPGGNCVNTAADSACLYPILTTSNAGTTGPAGSIYTDSYNPSLGTSFSTPLVAGTVALMYSARPAITPAQVRQGLQAAARPFPAPGSIAGDPQPPACTVPRYDASGNPVDQYECYCTTATCGAGMLDAGAALLIAKAGAGAGTGPAEGMWWAAPAGAEPGWGINIAQQDGALFATWFTFGPDGKPWWLVVRADRIAADIYSGTLYTGTGPPLSSAPFDPAKVVPVAVGTAAFTFAGSRDATFSTVVNGVAQNRAITLEVFGSKVPTCTWSAQANLAAATNFQDMWWAAPAGVESGWGLNLAHQGDTIFATWFTYGADGNPLWLVFAAPKAATNVYAGDVYTGTGPAFGTLPFDASQVTKSRVGTATLTFGDGNHATFAYAVNGIVGTKAITREIFGSAGGTVCE